MRSRISALIAASFFTLCVSAANATATLVTDGGGNLVGVNGLLVGSTLYDVTFSYGSCASNFSGCTSNSAFDFTTQASADAANSALLSQAIASSLFAEAPALIGPGGGCGGRLCEIETPFFTDGTSGTNDSAVYVWSFTGPTLSTPDSIPILENTGPGNTRVWSHWSAVPEPITLTLFGAGLAGAAVMRRRKKNAA